MALPPTMGEMHMVLTVSLEMVNTDWRERIGLTGRICIKIENLFTLLDYLAYLSLKLWVF